MLSNYIAPKQRFVTSPNQDVVYGAGFLALDREPVVLQVRDFGNRFWVAVLRAHLRADVQPDVTSACTV
jgi:hypothetical protein